VLLSKVQVRNFRGFESIDVELDPLTVLIGENNSGKTSFLEAIRLCLSRNIARRGSPLDDYDYHLSTAAAQPQDAHPLSITLDFLAPDDLPDEVIQTLGDIRVFDGEGRGHVLLRLNSAFDEGLKDFVSDWAFLDCEENSLPPKTKRPQVLAAFLQLKPVFFLSALRDAAREFAGRSTFWAPFMRHTGIPQELREKLAAELAALNDEVLKAHEPLQAIKTHLAKCRDILSSGKAGVVDIEALPGRVSDLLARAQVSISAQTGAKLPLTRHGSGTQSLSVLFLFEAFLATMLTEQYDEYSEPMLTLEEPEAHLHPSAIRSLWSALEAIPGQKLVATHSGDLLARVPVARIRRFARREGKVHVFRVSPATLSAEEQRKIDFHVRSSRGDLFFARCWLLVEGESEYWALSELAILMDLDLDRLGIRIVNHKNSGVEPLVKLANALGIEWFLLADGDAAGKQDEVICSAHLQGRQAQRHIRVLDHANIEVMLCEAGFGGVFKSHISQQKANTITLGEGDAGYWDQVLRALDRTPKPQVIREVMDRVQQGGLDSAPESLREALQAAKALADGQS